MKSRVAVVILTLSVAAFAQRGGGGGSHGASVGAGMGGGMGASSGPRGNSGSMHGPSGTQTTDHGKRSIDSKLSDDSHLRSKLESLLPKGASAKDACSGFKNLGQCVAAVHVSHNLGIPFDQLKAKVTGDNAESLGKAIGELKPDANAKAEEKKAKRQAKDDESGE